MCPRSADQFYVVTYYIKWVTTSWTYSTLAPALRLHSGENASVSRVSLATLDPPMKNPRYASGCEVNLILLFEVWQGVSQQRNGIPLNYL